MRGRPIASNLRQLTFSHSKTRLFPENPRIKLSSSGNPGCLSPSLPSLYTQMSTGMCTFGADGMFPYSLHHGNYDWSTACPVPFRDSPSHIAMPCQGKQTVGRLHLTWIIGETPFGRNRNFVLYKRKTPDLISRPLILSDRTLCDVVHSGASG